MPTVSVSRIIAEMRISILHRLLIVPWLTIVIATVATSGMIDACLLAAVSGLALYFGNRLAVRWTTAPWTDNILVAIALIASLLGTVYGLTIVSDHRRDLAEKSMYLQSQLRDDVRFKNVTTRYSSGLIVGHRILRVGGHVASHSDSNALHELAEREFWGFKTDVSWNVAVSNTMQTQAGR